MLTRPVAIQRNQRRLPAAPPSAPSAPSGIAQLRKTSEHGPLLLTDPMNLDDFIHNDNVGTPAGLALTPTPETATTMTTTATATAMRQQHTEETSAHTTAAAIPIKPRRESPQYLAPQSVPVAAHQRPQDEFGYVPRHPRKTSIDETAQRVSFACPVALRLRRPLRLVPRASQAPLSTAR